MMTVEKLNYTKSLNDLLSGLATVNVSVDVSGVAIDSRQVKPGDLFMAYRGTHMNGVDYIDDAIQAGAIAVLVDAAAEVDVNTIPATIVRVDDLRRKAGVITSRFYDEPSKAMNVIGVTGTNGKTTVSYMIAYALSSIGHSAALLGTLGYGQFKKIESGITTTPDPITLHSLFSSWKGDVDTVAMEVSSHALDQGRVAGTAFDTAVFTNLSRDHLDYHATLEDYAAAKFQLFKADELKNAIVNIDDDYGLQFLDKLPEHLNVIAYSTKPNQVEIIKGTTACVYLDKAKEKGLETELTIHSPWGVAEVKTKLLGQFNIENILAAYAALCVSGISIEQASLALSGFNGIPGRMEYFSTIGKPLLVVDYAHTPDALEKALIALRPYCAGQLYCVFGCGGDRDVGKRAQMGAIAEAHADQLVLTNDNPRSEEPEQIVENILEGIKDKNRVVTKLDRSDAIINTFLNAGKDDVVLIAGKGHETTQDIAGTISPFSDRELARRLTEGAA